MENLENNIKDKIKLTFKKIDVIIYLQGKLMKVVFNNEHLENLYTSGNDKQYKKVPGKIIRKFVNTVEVLKCIGIIQELFSMPGYKFEKLHGNDLYSLRMDITWRLTFTIDWESEEKKVGIIGLEDLTYHYQK